MSIFNLEQTLVSWLQQYVGYENAMRIEDSLMIFFTVLLGYIVGQLRLVSKFRTNYFLNDKLSHIVFQRNEYKSIVQYDFKKPKKILDKIDFIIGLHMANRNKHKLLVIKVKWYSRLALALLILLSIIIILVITSMLNIANNSM